MHIVCNYWIRCTLPLLPYETSYILKNVSFLPSSLSQQLGCPERKKIMNASEFYMVAEEKTIGACKTKFMLKLVGISTYSREYIEGLSLMCLCTVVYSIFYGICISKLCFHSLVCISMKRMLCWKKRLSALSE